MYCRMKDEQAGEVPVAFVVKSTGSTITEDDIKQFISKQVSHIFILRIIIYYYFCLLIINGINIMKITGILLQVIFYKRISRVFFVDAIPKNPSGKILRKDLKAILAATTPAPN